ncbi:Protein CBG11763 [Caenorhabditis briggsae]|uniref:Protein CBG11763 n=1 Tax=Caenorhabditis briggsae TaxID=6238 RepID=A8XE13_CAEBR|nr:Protein CBG11763 [Caenorhabditis briggsae]CAP30819.2 Protein CBG11763 [Caenorhabditis briggsae]
MTLRILQGRRRKRSQSKSSQLMSFCILGSVIGFILYTYFSHVIMMRRLNRENEASRLRELVHRSALIMAGSAHQNEYDFTERRHSLINMFKAFKL